MICWLISRPFRRPELTVHTQSGGTILQWLFGRIDPIQRTIHGQLSQHDDLRNKPSRPRVPFDSNSQIPPATSGARWPRPDVESAHVTGDWAVGVAQFEDFKLPTQIVLGKGKVPVPAT